MDSLTSLTTQQLQAKRADIRYAFVAQFAGVPKYLFSECYLLRRDRNQMRWEIRRIDRELARRTQPKEAL